MCHFGFAKKFKRKPRDSDSPSMDPEPSSADSLLNAVPEIEKLPQLSQTPQVTIHFERYGRFDHTVTIGKTLNRTSHPSEDIYRIGSLTKVFLAAAFVKLDCSEKYKSLGVTLDTPINTIIKRDRIRRRLQPVKWLNTNPTIKDLLLHRKGIPNDNQWLLGPDGTCIISAEKALRIAPELKQGHNQKGGDIEYSNWNYIIAGLVLEAIWQQHYGSDSGSSGEELIFTIMKSLLFDPLGMNETYIGWQPSVSLQTRIVPGYSIDSTMSVTPVQRNEDTAPPASMYPFGAWSSAKDIATFYKAIMRGLKEEDFGFFSHKEALNFVLYEGWETKETCHTLAGVGEYLTSNTLGSESLDNDLLGDQRDGCFGLGKLLNEESIMVNSKYGSVDGYNSCVYLVPFKDLVVIVLANSTGPLNVAGDIAHTIINYLLSLQPITPVLSFVEKRLGFTKNALDQIEMEDKAMGAKLCTGGDLVGSYCHEKDYQEIEVRENGDVYIRGDIAASGPFKFALHSPKKVQIIPGTAKFGIERYSYDTVFEVRRGPTGIPESLRKGPDVFNRR